MQHAPRITHDDLATVPGMFKKLFCMTPRLFVEEIAFPSDRRRDETDVGIDNPVLSMCFRHFLVKSLVIACYL